MGDGLSCVVIDIAEMVQEKWWNENDENDEDVVDVEDEGEDDVINDEG